MRITGAATEAWDDESDADADISEPGPTADNAESTWGSDTNNSPNPSLWSAMLIDPR